MALAPGHVESSGDVPPQIVGWVLVLVAGAIMVAGWLFAAAIILAGRFLAKQTRYTYCLVMGGIECLFMPFGTVLGVFTIIVITRDSVKGLFPKA